MRLPSDLLPARHAESGLIGEYGPEGVPRNAFHGDRCVLVAMSDLHVNTDLGRPAGPGAGERQRAAARGDVGGGNPTGKSRPACHDRASLRRVESTVC
ncbi:hypothetical protein GCM10018987_01600 [Streptomyces cremeus]